MSKWFACLLIFSALPPGLSHALTAREVMERLEANQNASSEALAFEMVLTDKSGFQRRRLVREFRLRNAGGLDDSLIFFDDPPDIRGSALLSRERADGWDDQWMFLPAVGKIRRIADSGRTDYFLGADLTFEDLSVEDIDHFSYRFAAPDTVVDGRVSASGASSAGVSDAGRPAHVIDAVPADTAAGRRSGYGLRRVYVDSDRSVILKTEYFDGGGKLIKVLSASQVKGYGSLWRADEVSVDNYARNHKTRLLVRARRLDVSFPPDLFTPRSLQRASVPEMLSRPTRTTPETR